MPPVKPPFGTPLNRAHPLAQGLVGCWLLNEGSGNKAYDSSGNGNHGTLSGFADPATATSGWCAGPHGGSLRYSNSYINSRNAAPLRLVGPFTIFLCGVKIISTLTYNILFDFFNSSGGASYGYALNLHSGKPMLTIFGPTGGEDWDATVSIADGLTHTIAGVYDGSNKYIYIDDILNNTKSWNKPPGYTSANLGIGKRIDLASYLYNGELSSGLLYNRALSPSEVSYLNAFPYCMFEQDDSIFSKPFNQNYYRRLLAGGY